MIEQRAAIDRELHAFRTSLQRAGFLCVEISKSACTAVLKHHSIFTGVVIRCRLALHAGDEGLGAA
jgi:hypothetical protein